MKCKIHHLTLHRIKINLLPSIGFVIALVLVGMCQHRIIHFRPCSVLHRLMHFRMQRRCNAIILHIDCDGEIATCYNWLADNPRQTVENWKHSGDFEFKLSSVIRLFICMDLSDAGSGSDRWQAPVRMAFGKVFLHFATFPFVWRMIDSELKPERFPGEYSLSIKSVTLRCQNVCDVKLDVAQRTSKLMQFSDVVDYLHSLVNNSVDVVYPQELVCRWFEKSSGLWSAATKLLTLFISIECVMICSFVKFDMGPRHCWLVS